jgi:hypothetical protein
MQASLHRQDLFTSLCAAWPMTEPNWITAEQEFTHQYFLMQAKKLDKEELLDLFEHVHKQYLVNHRLFKSLMKWCACEGSGLPSFDKLLSDY